jgi:hypothetical protein
MMCYNRSFLLAFCSLFFSFANAQFRFIKAHSDQEDRLLSLDFKSFDTYRNHSQTPQLLESLNLMERSAHRFNDTNPITFNNAQFNYFEWSHPEYFGNKETQFIASKRQYLGGFLKHPNRFYSWESEDQQDYIVINPILDMGLSPLMGPFDSALYNGRGVEVYGQMGERLTFYSQLYDYQAGYPIHIDQYYQKNKVYPGIGWNNRNSFGFNDFFYATAYMDVILLKKTHDTTGKGYKIHATLGHDKQHIGSGFRSLILSNFSPPSLFLQIHYRLGPFKYQNLFKELVMDMTKDTFKMFNKKYLAMHRGSLHFDQLNLELGFSEMIIQSRPNNSLDMNYLNPVIFYRSIERDLGSSDNALIAFDAKWTQKQFMIYGQFVIDEFNFSAMLGNRNSYLNKYANQIGLYIKPNSSFFKQSYVQIEYNAVRPYTYSHRRGSSNHVSHYNQALAHPLESNFRELIFRFFGVPKTLQRWSFKNTTILSYRGLNTSNENYGSDFRLPYNTTVDKENAMMLQGLLERRINMSNTIAYYMQPNLKCELTHQWFQSISDVKTNQNYLFFSIKYNFTDTRETYLF